MLPDPFQPPTPSQHTLATVQHAAEDESQRDIIHKMLSDLLITISDQVFRDRTVSIDGYRFINCRFENCNLLTQRGTFEFHHCVTAGGKYVFNHDAMKTIQLFRAAAPVPPEKEKIFSCQKYPDGSFSIAKGVSL